MQVDRQALLIPNDEQRLPIGERILRDMGTIVPAIIPTSQADLEEKLARLSGLVESVQIDVVDGRFAIPNSWPYLQGNEEVARIASEEFMLPSYEEFRFEIDLMVSNPEEVMGSWIDAGASRITVHAESVHSLEKLFARMKISYGHDKEFAPDLLALGIAINIDTDLALIEPCLKDVNYVQFMGIKRIGRQGEPFDPRVLQKITTFRKKNPDIAIQVDGGVTAASIPDLLSAGVSRLIVGSSIWKAPSIEEQLRTFEALTEEYGVFS